LCPPRRVDWRERLGVQWLKALPFASAGRLDLEVLSASRGGTFCFKSTDFSAVPAYTLPFKDIFGVFYFLGLRCLYHPLRIPVPLRGFFARAPKEPPLWDARSPGHLLFFKPGFFSS